MPDLQGLPSIPSAEERKRRNVGADVEAKEALASALRSRGSWRGRGRGLVSSGRKEKAQLAPRACNGARGRRSKSSKAKETPAAKGGRGKGAKRRVVAGKGRGKAEAEDGSALEDLEDSMGEEFSPSAEEDE